jgi:PQQ-dependent catabolism-associated CXXCW motif protein
MSRLVASRLTLLACVLLTPPLVAQDSFGGQPAPPAPAPAAPAAPAAPRPTAGARPDQDAQMAAERQDFGVPPTAELHAGPMHAPTPASIPGGQVITTRGLVELLGNTQVRALVFDVLGGQERIPGALAAVPAAQAGSFRDQTQQEFGGFLRQMTQGSADTPLVFYCLSSHCWMSYNAALRAINMGYRNVLWYRGGIEAWKAAGQRVEPNGPR